MFKCKKHFISWFEPKPQDVLRKSPSAYINPRPPSTSTPRVSHNWLPYAAAVIVKILHLVSSGIPLGMGWLVGVVRIVGILWRHKSGDVSLRFWSTAAKLQTLLQIQILLQQQLQILIQIQIQPTRIDTNTNKDANGSWLMLVPARCRAGSPTRIEQRAFVSYCLLWRNPFCPTFCRFNVKRQSF